MADSGFDDFLKNFGGENGSASSGLGNLATVFGSVASGFGALAKGEAQAAQYGFQAAAAGEDQGLVATTRDLRNAQITAQIGSLDEQQSLATEAFNNRVKAIGQAAQYQTQLMQLKAGQAVANQIARSAAGGVMIGADNIRQVTAGMGSEAKMSIDYLAAKTGTDIEGMGIDYRTGTAARKTQAASLGYEYDVLNATADSRIRRLQVAIDAAKAGASSAETAGLMGAGASMFDSLAGGALTKVAGGLVKVGDQLFGVTDTATEATNAAVAGDAASDVSSGVFDFF